MSRIARIHHLLERAWPELFTHPFILEAEITTLDDESVSSRSGTPAGSTP